MRRECGDCQLCCKLLPVRELGKKASERCKHQRFNKGCAVYHRSGMPSSCALWTCQWLTNQDMADQSRPDRSHLVVDVMPDYITMRYEGEEDQKLQVVQVWCDPQYRNAHRDPAFRRYLARRGEEGIAALIRFGRRDAMTLFPPALSQDGEFHEVVSNSTMEERRPEDIAEFLSGAKLGIEL